jgi:hypothetical protein
VGFVLRVTEGAGEGEEFSFEGGEVRLGRTADNDVVIKDPSSSRSHCRIFEKGGLRYVEDLKSANGTIVNDEPLSTPHALSSGDRITVGDVVMVYETDEVDPNATLLKPPDSTVDEAGDEDPNATILKPPSAPPPPARRATGTSKALSRPSRAVKREPEPEPEPPPEDEAANTGDLDEEPAPEDDGADEEVSGNSTKNFEVPPPKALASRRGTSGSRAPVRASRAPSAPISAADRARQRRELSQSAGGKLQLMWQDLPKPAQIAVALVGGLFTLGFMALVVTAVLPKRVAKKAEPVELVPNANPIAESFGEGDGVDFPRADMKTFTIQAASPTRIVGVVHYQAKDISKDEVLIELNGVQLGSVPADSLDVDQRELDVVLPAESLKPRESNSLVFDNVNNPPGDDPWRIWNLWVEIIPVPEMTADEAARQAREQVEKAARFYDQRNVGAENLFRAWKTYRDAWLLLESTPNRSEELLTIARTRMREIRPELDAKCSAMLVGYKQAITQKNQDLEKARRVLEGIPSHFPTREHACYNISRALLADLDELGEMPTH